MSLEDKLYPLLGLYDRMPVALKRGLGLAYRSLPERVRLGGGYRGFVDLTQSGEGWTPAQAWDYQRQELRRVLTHAASTCPFYSERFKEAGFDPDSVDAPQGLARCPFLTKQDVISARDRMTSTHVPDSKRLYITTGGSTGVPVGFYLERGVSRPKEQAFLEAMWKRAGYEAGDRLVVIRGHVVDSRAGGRIASYDATRDWMMLSSYHLTQDRLPEYLAEVERFRPALLHAYPSAALQLAEYLERVGQSWRTPLKALLCGSERLTLPQKRLLERVFGCRVYRWYGHSERVVLAGEGRRSEWFYFWPQYGFVEFGPADPEGFQEVIGTSFHNRAMPLIRYRTGDFVRLAPEAPDAGREYAWPAAVEIAGREQEFLVSRTGRRISLTAFNMHDSIFDFLYAVQFYQDTPGVAEFRFVAGPQFHSSRLAAIEQGIRRKLGDDFDLTFREVRETERTARGKHQWIVSKLKGS